MDVSKLAEQARKQFYHGGERSIWQRKDSAPEWVEDLVFAAHGKGDFLPDDWRYTTIVEALDFISEREGADFDDERHEFADCVDVYNSDLTDWLKSHGHRQSYVDDAVKEFGHSDNGIIGDIMLGQYAERDEVFGSVLQSLTERLEEMEAETEEVQS